MASGGNLGMEMGLERPDFREDVPVEFVLGDGSLPARPGAVRLFLILPVMTEGHGSQHDIHALEEHVFLGIDFRDVGWIDQKPHGPEAGVAWQCGNESLELQGVLLRMRKLVQEQPQTGALGVYRHVSEAESVL